MNEAIIGQMTNPFLSIETEDLFTLIRLGGF